MFDYQNFKARFDEALEQGIEPAVKMALTEINKIAGDASAVIQISSTVILAIDKKEKANEKSAEADKPAIESSVFDLK